MDCCGGQFNWTYLFIFVVILFLAIIYILYNSFKPAGRGQPCNTTNNCQNGLICSDMNVCIFNPELGTTAFPGTNCYAETECPENYYCSTVGKCLVVPESTAGQPCKNDQDCGVGYNCGCSRVCQIGPPIYETTTTPQTYSLAFRDLFMGTPKPDLTIGFNRQPYTTQNIFKYNPNVKVLTRAYDTTQFLVYDEQGIIKENSDNPNTSNQIYIR